MNNGKEDPTWRATWILKYKKGSLDMKFRDNILRNIIGKVLKTWRQIKARQLWDQSGFNHLKDLFTFIIEDKRCIFPINRKIFFQNVSVHSTAFLKSGDIIHISPVIEEFYGISIKSIRIFRTRDAVVYTPSSASRGAGEFLIRDRLDKVLYKVKTS